MAAQKGKDILIKIGDGASPESFTTVAGIRTRTLSLNAKTVDATDSDSVGQWRELLAGGGVRSMAVSGSGVFRDAGSDAMMQAAFFNQTTPDWQLVIPSFGVIEGPFQIAALEYAGQHEGEATFSISLASAGALSFTAAS
jgi:TP901-1 family phage major tail protein